MLIFIAELLDGNEIESIYIYSRVLEVVLFNLNYIRPYVTSSSSSCSKTKMGAMRASPGC